MKSNPVRLLLLLILILVSSCGKTGQTSPDVSPPTSGDPTAAIVHEPETIFPYSLISQDSLFEYLIGLTEIQAYSGWRSSASLGEREALEFVEQQLSQMEYMKNLGLEMEWQDFRVFLGAELWETSLTMTMGEQEFEVPADGMKGPRDDVASATKFDSDGSLNDSTQDPITVAGPSILLRSREDIEALTRSEAKGKIVLLDYAVVDRSVMGIWTASEIADDLASKQPTGIVLVTSFSTQIGESHGGFVGDLSAFNTIEAPLPPTLYVRLEDMASAGIHSLEDLARVEGVRLVWDVDVHSPATSANLIARIPGEDSSKAMILGAHIDSPNGPGAMDDGSGSVILIEIARVLNEAKMKPPVDLYLAWFGSEEVGLYGSSHFAATHQELLDKTLAMLQIDCLTRPLDGIDARLDLVGWSYTLQGDSRMVWLNELKQIVAQHGIAIFPMDLPFIYSDNNALNGYGVPNADLIYEKEPEMENAGGVHYAGLIHNPYDTVELAREVGDILEHMAYVALAAALETPKIQADLRVAPPPEHRVLFIASHTEAVHVSPAAFIDMGMTLVMEGYDVDLLPYGQAITDADLQDTDMVIVLPVLDYPSPDGDPDQYDESWREEEVNVLENYVLDGGFLVITNSANRLKYNNYVLDSNEDSLDVNALASRFGVTFLDKTLMGALAQTEGDHPLIQHVSTLDMAGDNAVDFTLSDGTVLARSDDQAVVALVEMGDAGGQVLVLADVGMLGSSWGQTTNLPFWQNLARHAINH